LFFGKRPVSPRGSVTDVVLEERKIGGRLQWELRRSLDLKPAQADSNFSLTQHNAQPLYQ
jgi:hypothetical protein